MFTDRLRFTTLQLLRYDFIYQLWVALALRSFHNLPNEKSQHCFLARPILLDLFGISRNDFIR